MSSASICAVVVLCRASTLLPLLLQGALRGVGHQVKILCFNAMGFWGVGVSTGVVLTFVAHWGLKGVWTGIMMGVMATCLLNLLGLLAVNWQRSAEQASGKAGDKESDVLSEGPAAGNLALLGDKGRQATWWDALSEKLLGKPSTHGYSLVHDVQEMQVLVTDTCDPG